MSIRLSTLVLSLLLAAPAGAAAQRQDFPLRITGVQVVGRSAEMGELIGGAVGPSGEVYVADYQNARIVAFSPTGELLWTAGRKGDGPGEFQLPYRIAVRTDGAIFVFDRNTGSITQFSRAGRYAARYRLPFGFRAFDHFVALANGQFVVAGTTSANPRVERFALHRFAVAGSELKHVVSFGALPVVRDREVLNYWGAGSLTPAANGGFLFTRRLPYEIYQYAGSGDLRRTVRYPTPLRGSPDDAYRIVADREGRTISRTEATLTWPGLAFELPGGWILGSRVSASQKSWDLFTPSGHLGGSVGSPAGWEWLIGVDATRRVMWAYGTVDDEPVVFRARFQLVGSGPSSAAMLRIIGVCVAIGLAALIEPGEAEAQCGSVCVQLFAPDGSPGGWGCGAYPDSRTDCTAKVSICREDSCALALVTDPNGATLASVSPCRTNAKAILTAVRTKPARAVNAAKLAMRPAAVPGLPKPSE